MIVPLSKQLNLLVEPNPVLFHHCNCLYIKDDRRAVIDSGLGKEDLNFLLGEHIDIVINTHFHEDHIMQNHRFRKSDIWAHRLDAPAIRSMETFVDFYGMTDHQDRMLISEFIKSIDLQPSPVHRELEDGDILDFGSVNFKVIYTPGHSAGHCSFHEEKSNILFSGDIDLTSFGPWYGHECSDLDDFVDSIHKCMDIKPEVLIPAHSPMIHENIQSRLQDYLGVIFRKEELVKEALSQPQTLDQLVAKHIFYGRAGYRYPAYNGMERSAIRKHLNRLLRLNEIKQYGQLYYRL